MKISYKTSILLSLIIFGVTAVNIVRAAGEVDRTFSTAVQNGLKGSVQTIIKQPDGKILVGGLFTVVNNSGRVAIARFNADGTVDPTFNAPDFYALSGNGFRIDLAGIGKIAVQADGKILIGGNFVRINTQTAVGFLRLNADGSIDTTFNPDLPAGTTSAALIKIQSDNKIIVFVNTPNSGNVSVRLIRLNADGSRDTSFQEVVDRISALEILPDGKILVGTDSQIYRLNPNGSLDVSYNSATLQSSGVSKFVVLPDGKVLVGGSFRIINNITVNYIARLNADGTVDTTFNSGGTGANSPVYGLDVLPDGKIVIGGAFSFYNGVARNKTAWLNSDGTLDTTFNYNPGGSNFASVLSVTSAGDGKVYLGATDAVNVFEKLVRLNSDGTRDTGFNVTFYQPAKITQVIGQPDGKVIITGDFTKVYGIDRLYFARLNADGTLDTAFDPIAPVGFEKCFGIALQPDGKILCGTRRYNADGTLDASFQPPAGQAFKILVQPDGKILFGGYFSAPNNPTVNVIRVNSDGSADATFNPIRITQASSSPTSNAITGLKLQADGKIVVTGNFIQINNLNRGRIARFNTDGTIDPTFFSTVGANNDVYDVIIQSDGKIVIGGNFSSVNGVNNIYYLARLLPDSNLDTSFVGNPNAPVYAVEKQADDKILIGGLFNAVGGIAHPYLARLNPNGSPDTFGGIGPNDTVWNINVSPNGKILVGGNFTRVDLFSTIGAARLAGSASNAPRPLYDFDGDGKADVSVFRPANGFWYQLRSANGAFNAFQFGQNGDLIAPADYDGDGKTDIAVWRGGTFAYFYIFQSSDNTFRFEQFGQSGDLPMSGDWDGDGKADAAVYRPANTPQQASFFYYRPSAQPNVSFNTIGLGILGDKPLYGDFDGDGKLDAAIFRPSTVSWQIKRSSDNQLTQTTFGAAGDIPVPADYDGDGLTNIAVFRPSTGYWYTSTNVAINYGAILFGVNGDLPVPADYDGDGRADVAVFRPSNGAWYEQRSTQGFAGVSFGASGDKPIPNAYIR